MHRSRLVVWRRLRQLLGAAGLVIALSAMPAARPGVLAQPSSARQNPDWPCRQILVGRVSPAAVWSGPSIEGVSWRNDSAVADVVARLAARRTPVEDAEGMIEQFARSQGSDKNKLIAVFAGVFETLNDERSQVIEGLLRFGAKQRELAEKIRAEKASSRENATGPPPDAANRGTEAKARELEWDLRVFDERRQSIAFVCDTPTLIEQRLFAIARIIQRYFE